MHLHFHMHNYFNCGLMMIIVWYLVANVIFWTQEIILANLIQNLMLVFFLAIQTQAKLMECISKKLWLWKNLYMLSLMSSVVLIFKMWLVIIELELLTLCSYDFCIPLLNLLLVLFWIICFLNIFIVQRGRQSNKSF